MIVLRKKRDMTGCLLSKRIGMLGLNLMWFAGSRGRDAADAAKGGAPSRPLVAASATRLDMNTIEAASSPAFGRAGHSCDDAPGVTWSTPPRPKLPSVVSRSHSSNTPLLSYGLGDRTTARITVSLIPRRALLPRGSRGRRDKLKAFLRSAFEGERLSSPWDNREPIREELFGVERLEDHARSLAVAQIVSSRTSKGRVLAKRLAENRAVLLRAYRATVKAINDARPVTPASEWLVDNYHLVERRIHEIRSDLPPGYYRQLPKLADGPFTGYPRVFGIAWAFIAHSDSRFNSEMLVRFVRAYQEVQPLTIGELWAVSITLRIVLIEISDASRSRLPPAVPRGIWRTDSLTGCSARADDGRTRRHCSGSARAPAALAGIRGPARSSVTRSRSDGHPRAASLDERLTIQDTTTEIAVRDVHRQQGAANVSVRNIITSLRLISDVDWKQLFERLSLVDAVLAADSGFETMDFPTRTLYRSAIEDLSRGSNRAELDIAGAAVLAAKQAGAEAPAMEQERGGSRLHPARRRGPRLRKVGSLSPALAKLGVARQPICRCRRLCDIDLYCLRNISCGAAARP